IFSLGAVLYEMLTGKKAFEGKSQVSVASAILEQEPAPISNAKPMTPPSLEHSIKKCLSKSPEDRWQSARDLASELEGLGEGGSQAIDITFKHSTSKFRERVAWLISSALVIVLIVTSVWLRNSKPREETMYFPAPMAFP